MLVERWKYSLQENKVIMELKPTKILVQYEADGDMIDITDLDLKRYEAFLEVMKGIDMLYYHIKGMKDFGDVE